MSDLTRILSAVEAGDVRAAEELLPLIYEELRKLAAQKLSHEKPGQTIDATGLVHEAYLRLVATPHEKRWDGRAHFFAAAAEAMRRILVENARRKRRPKCGGDLSRIHADLSLVSAKETPVDLLSLDEALSRLAEESPARAELVKLRFFAGLTVPQAAQTLGISLATAERYWTYSRTWLYAELSDANSAASPPDRPEAPRQKQENRRED